MSDFQELDRFTPGDPADPNGDRATLRQLEEAGADLAKSTHFIHYLVFPDEQRARAGGQLIAETLGYEVRGSAPEKPKGEWLVMAEREQVPTLENIERMRQALTAVAEQHAGEYDGWEAAVES